MQLPESFYIALCGTILLLGVIYWFWTQIQYIQRKVNLLDNVVYEMKTFISNLPGQTESLNVSENTQTEKLNLEEQKQEIPYSNSYAPPPESIAGDLEEERANTEAEFSAFIGSTSSDISNNNSNTIQIDELTPGGLAMPSVSSTNINDIDKSLESPLQTMTTKELRRMAEANNIPGASTKGKKELVKILRDTVGAIIQKSDNKPEIMSFEDISAPLME